jgi:hypothetical protein
MDIFSDNHSQFHWNIVTEITTIEQQHGQQQQFKQLWLDFVTWYDNFLFTPYYRRNGEFL